MTHHCKNRELTVAMAAQYDMDESHVAFVTGSGKDTNKVQSVVEDAQELREAQAVEHSGGAFEGASAGETRVDETAGDDADDADDGDGQLSGEESGDDADDDDSVPSEGAEDDESQSGLSDFM